MFSNLPKKTASKKLKESNDPLTYIKREGTTDLGKIYEDYLPAYLTLQLLQDEEVKDFRLSTNDGQFGDFDDLIVEVDYTSEQTEKYALQLKHKKNKTLKSEHLQKDNDFNILKYYKSFQKCSKLSEYKLILYTNAKLNVCSSNFSINLENSENVKVKITECDPFLLINTPEKGRSFQFQLDPENSEEIKQKYKDFFERFCLYTNQMNVHQLEHNYIIRSFSALTSRSFVTDKFLKFISKWNVAGGIKTKLTKDMIIKVITLYIVDNLIQPHTFCDVNEEKKLFQKAMSHFNITAFNNKSLENVVKIWGDSKNILRGCDIQEIKEILKQFQISTKYITNIDELTDEESTKLLWVIDKCPLIIQDHPAAYEAAKLCGGKSKFVFITEKLKDDKLGELTVFRTLCDLKLHQPTYNDIVKNFAFTLFGKKTHLEDLIEEDRVVEDLLTTDLFAKMTKNPDLIKLKEEQLCFPYVRRHLNKSIIDLNYLLNLDKNTMVLISNVTDAKKLRVKFQNFQIVALNEAISSGAGVPSEQMNLIVNTTETSRKQFNMLREKNEKYQKFHHFRWHEKCLEWIESIGDVSDLQKFFTKNYNFVEDEKLYAENIRSNVKIIVGDPGMGKSVFVKNVKNNLLSKYFTVLMQPIDIPELCRFIKDSGDVQKFFSFILQSKFRNFGNFERQVLKILMEKGRAVYLWDALDELSKQNRNTVKKLIVTLSKNSVAQFLTTRGFLRKDLEDEFNVFSQELEPFNNEQQRNYIQNRLQNICSDEELESITKGIIKNIADISYREILGIPLQIYMLTELFRQDLEKYKKLFTDLFVITDLYSYFIEEKIKFHLKKQKPELADNYEDDIFLRRNISRRRKNYQQIALKSLFGTLLYKQPNIELDDLLNEIKIEGDEFGFITAVDTNLQPEFLHNSYTEYLAAIYLAENCRNIPHLKDVLFKRRYANVRYFFDTLLAKKCPVHIAVLCKNLNYLQNCEDEDELKKKDMHGRNALHLAASWGERYPLLEIRQDSDTIYINDNIDFGTKKENSVYHKIIETLLTNCDFYGEKDQLFHLTPTMYAEKCECLFAAALIEKRQGNKNYLKTKNKEFVYSLLYYGIKYGFHDIADLFANIKFALVPYKSSLLHMAVENNQLQYLSKLLEWEVYEQNINYRNVVGATPLIEASDIGYIETVKYLIEKQADVNTANIRSTTSLHFASRNGHLDIVKYLVEKQADVNAAAIDGKTSLHFASENGHLEIVKYLLEKQADVSTAYIDGRTSLHFASRNGHLKIVKYLIEKQADVNAATINGATSLHFANKNGHLEIVKYLIEKQADVNAADKYGRTSLHFASRDGHLKIVEYLIEKQADVNAVAIDGATSLHFASENGHLKIVKYLIEKQADVNTADIDGRTSLHQASRNGHFEIGQYLIEKQADVNAADKYGCTTSLHLASKNGHLKIVKYLIEKQADVNAAVKYGRTSLHFASKNGHFEIVKYMIEKQADINAADKYGGTTSLHFASKNGHLKIVKYLIEKQADVNAADKYGRTSLHFASKNGHFEIVKYMIEKQADVNAADKYLTTSLHFASENGHLEIVKYLIEKQADVNAANIDGTTSLHFVSRNGHFEIVKYLIEKQVDVNAADKYGRTSLRFAYKNGHLEIVNYLIEKQADVNAADKQFINSNMLFLS